MHYTIHQLKIFLKVVETENITKAAEQLFMTQPAVSIQLKNFQDQFSVPLTEVIGRQLYITDFGKEVALLAQKALEELNEIEYKTREYEGILSGKLKISCASTGKYVIPFFLAGFLDLHSGIDVTLDVTNKAKVIESLKRNEIDFALISTLPDDMELEEIRLLENKLYLVGNTNTYSKNSPLIYREDGSATRKAMEQYFSKQVNVKRKKFELTSNEAVKQAVIAGLGFSILPLIGIKNEILNNELQIVPMKGLPIKTTWRLIWMKGKKLSPIATSFLKHIETNKKMITERNFSWYNEIL